MAKNMLLISHRKVYSLGVWGRRLLLALCVIGCRLLHTPAPAAWCVLRNKVQGSGE